LRAVPRAASVDARGYIGMTWSERYVGREYSMLESHVVTEELRAADAPVGAHWIVAGKARRCCCAMAPSSIAPPCFFAPKLG
jgi:alkylation response protein AidB-like acyl-CoA dehydrogenase